MHGDHAVHLFWNRAREICAEEERICKLPHVVYAVWLSPDLLKIGYTSNIKKRLTYYRQEGRRHGSRAGMWWACAGFERREDARLMEKYTLEKYRDCRMPKHREWFKCANKDFHVFTQSLQAIRRAIGNERAEVKERLGFLVRSNIWSE